MGSLSLARPDPSRPGSPKPPPLTATLTATVRQRRRTPVGAVICETDDPYFGDGDTVVIDLAAARVRARQERMKADRIATCGVCVGGHDSGASQLQRAECGMS